MDRERHVGVVLRARCHIEPQLEVVVVIHSTAHDLERLIDRLARQNINRNRCRERVTVRIDLQTVGIGGIDHT